MGPAFGRRCIPAGCVAPPSKIPDILGCRALPSGRLAALGATSPFMRWVLVAEGLPLARHDGCYMPRHDGRDDVIAVVGMACRVPGAPNVDRFWKNLSEGIESIS